MQGLVRQAGERWVGFPPTAGEHDSGHTLARFGLALVPDSSVRDELRQGALVALDIPAMQTAIPITAIHRRNGYLSPAAKRLLALLTSGALQPKVRRPMRSHSRITD